MRRASKKKSEVKPAPYSGSPTGAIPQVRLRFPGDAPRMSLIGGTVSLYDVMVNLSVPAAKKLAREIGMATRKFGQ